jgi:hypothetical protein
MQKIAVSLKDGGVIQIHEDENGEINILLGTSIVPKAKVCCMNSGIGGVIGPDVEIDILDAVRKILDEALANARVKEQESDVHTRHCCKVHGCKYGEDDTCPVVQGRVEQTILCGSCEIRKTDWYK